MSWIATTDHICRFFDVRKKQAALARLGRKYQFQDLRADAIDVFQRSFPAELEAYTVPYVNLSSLVSYPGIFVDVANLAYEEEIYLIRPGLLLLLADLPLSILLEERRRPDGSVLRASHDTLTSVIRGQDILIGWQSEYCLAWMNAPSAGCPQSHKCARNLLKM